MYICHAPSTKAPRNATNATQKCARTSFLAWNTAQPFSAPGLGNEFVPWQYLHPRPHRFVAGAAVFVTWHQLLTGLRERCRERRHEARDEHCVRIGAADDEAVDGVGGRAAEGHRHPFGHDDALRDER